MKKVLIIVSFFFVSNLISQNTTFVPDDNFEQALIDMGLDVPPLDNLVLTDSIRDLHELFILNRNISDLTGIKDFRGLEHLQINNNNITSIDLSRLTRLISFSCENNQLTSLDISNNPRLQNIFIDNNDIEVLDTSNNPLITFITIVNNRIRSIDLSNSENLKLVELDNNNLSFLDLRNENNTSIERISMTNNPALQCIFVDNITYSETNWTQKDATSFYVETERQCYNLTCNVEIDTLENITICSPYTLPQLTHGNYYTESNGQGAQLNAGDIITSSQTLYIYNIDPDDPVCFNETMFSITICVDTKNDEYPSFFTPNNDGVNDVWKVKTQRPIKNIYIFDRFGVLLANISPQIGWNGLSNGKKVSSNTYWYQIIFSDDNSIKTGKVALLRR